MAAGYELTVPPSAAHLQLELERSAKVAETLDYIFQNPRPPSVEEVIYCELFRGVELRELRGATITQNRLSQSVYELLELVRNPVPPSPVRRKDVIVVIEERRLEDIIEEDNEDSDTNSSADAR
ncbi:hypothetical protein WA026_000377 [Henosepilachna vigintioctopunctata]|uniref:Uncharacterized protein n=1 Tax=Henosepilachna vigintioctopunctata TaxID=420089 RepID=A0AAW1UXF2_9CUCU